MKKIIEEYRKQSKLDMILFGYEGNSNYGGNSPGLIMLLGPVAIPFYLTRYLVHERRESKLKSLTE